MTEGCDSADMYQKELTIGHVVNVSFVIVVGSILAALGYSLFQVPFNLAAGGVGGLSIIINKFTGISEGLLFFLFNIPLLVLGFYKLGRWYFLIFTLLSVLIFSVASDLCIRFVLPVISENPITEDMLLSSIYGGLIGGIGGGLVLRVGGSTGGTNVLGKLIHQKYGFPMSQSYLITDAAIILFAAIVFSWDVGLHALLSLFLNGLASDYVFEGPSIIRIATIITDKPEDVADVLIKRLNRGVSAWQVKGLYTGEQHYMLYCAIYRSQINLLKHIVAKTDDKAFVVIGDGHQALGKGFIPLKKV